MALIYITGSPGTGKSTICTELQKRGYNALDEHGFSFWFNRDTNELIENIPEFRSPEWYQQHVFKFSRENVAQLANDSRDKLTFLFSQTFYDAEVWDLFDKTIFLTVTPTVLAER